MSETLFLLSFSLTFLRQSEEEIPRLEAPPQQLGLLVKAVLEL